MANNSDSNETKTKFCIKNVVKGFTWNGSRKFNDWLVTLIFVLFLVPAYADTDSGMRMGIVEHTSDELKRYENITPILQHSRTERHIYDTRLENGLHVDDIKLRYSYDEKDVIIDLKLNYNLIPQGHFMSYQLPNGTYVDQHFSETEVTLCHYTGSIRNNAESCVAISTCNGIQGVIYDGNETYSIETKRNGNKTEEHFLYRHSDRVQIPINNFTCKVGAVEPVISRKVKRSAHQKIRGPYNANDQSSFVELVFVVDNSVYNNLDRNLHKVHNYCKDIANVVNALFAPLNIFITLVGIVVWSEGNEIEISSNAQRTFHSFLEYRRNVLLVKYPNDNAHLLTNHNFDGLVVGEASVGLICEHEKSGGITKVNGQSTSMVAATVAHEIGHNLGMLHDTDDCECEKIPCIMATVSDGKTLPIHWSSCSKHRIQLNMNRGLFHCLRNKPSQLFGNSKCGNGFVEHGEQCDCGPAEFCKNSCCDPHTCKLRANASCATGECCDLLTCQPRSADTICRWKNGECDLPEHCNGKSEYCPQDTFKRDTELCGGGKAYCYEGACQSHDDQCKLVWGRTGKSVDECYGSNVEAKRHGHCGYVRTNGNYDYKKCAKQDIMCGQLHCNSLSENPVIGHGTQSWSPVYPYVQCNELDMDVLQSVDPGFSPNGAICGEGKMCVHQKCLSLESLRARGIGVDCPENCNGHGICNNKGQCHCDDGYVPPLCNAPEKVISGPDFIGPDFNRPDFNGPDYNEPDFIGPDFNRPVFNGPDYNEPDFNGPDYNEPDFIVPDFNRPDFNRPDFNRPDFNRPDFNGPELNRPDFNTTDQNGSVTSLKAGSGIIRRILYVILIGVVQLSVMLCF